MRFRIESGFYEAAFATVMRLRGVDARRAITSKRAPAHQAHDTDLYEVFCTVLYLVCTGCVSDQPPHLEQSRDISQDRVHVNHRGHHAQKFTDTQRYNAAYPPDLYPPVQGRNWLRPASSLAHPLQRWPCTMG